MIEQLGRETTPQGSGVRLTVTIERWVVKFAGQGRLL
jgi:hypothetical protein